MFLKIGHRGAMGYEPENTLRSFRKAIDLGADMIELDVHRCKSGELVVIHDETVDRTTNGRGRVSEMSLAELKKLDAGKGEKIPTLEEVLDTVDRRVKVNIELKGTGTAESTGAIIGRYISEHHWKGEDFLVSSFNWDELRAFHKMYPESSMGVLAKEVSLQAVDLAKDFGAYAIHFPRGTLDKQFLDRVHDLGMRVFSWNVNDPSDIQKVKALGVDGIFSDYPDRL